MAGPTTLTPQLQQILAVGEQIAVLLGTLPHEDERMKALNIARELVPADPEILERRRRGAAFDTMIDQPADGSGTTDSTAPHASQT